jgi:hypothetical protein
MFLRVHQRNLREKGLKPQEIGIEVKERSQ